MKKYMIGLFLLTAASLFGMGDNESNQNMNFDDKVTTAQLGGADRYLTYLSTDKPVYRTGDMLYLRGVILHAKSNEPLASVDFSAYIAIKGPKGDVAIDSYAAISDSVFSFQWAVPLSLSGGEYTVNVTYPDWNGGYTSAERKFEIRAYRPPRMKTQITFLKDGYYPGETVKAFCEIKRAEGDVPVGAEINIIARIDNNEIANIFQTLPASGSCETSFTLPLNIVSGDATVVFIIKDGGVTESASKTIPIILDDVALAFYPEGGDLIAGVENRVYFEAMDKNQKPVSVDGFIVDKSGKQITTIKAEHEGRGVFAFTPKPENSYICQVNMERGKIREYPLPVIKSGGVSLKSEKPVYKKKEPISIVIASPVDKTVSLVLSKREEKLITNKAVLKAGKPQTIPLIPPASAEGIMIVTVYEGELPVAERLIYREPAETIIIDYLFNKEIYAPGDTVELTVKTMYSNGQPVEAFVGVTVTEDTVLQLIDKREQVPVLPAMIFLENDVRDLKDAHVYLDSKNPRAALQLDLLLGTQGWRRFAFIRFNEFVQNFGEKAKRAAAFRLVLEPPKPARGNKFMMFENFGAMPAPMAEADDRMMFREEEGIVKEDAAGMAAEIAMEDIIVANDEPLAKMDIDDEKNIIAAEQDQYMLVRVYAHRKAPNWSADKRTDFTETVYWSAAIKTEAGNGIAKINFDLNDNITSYRIISDCFDKQGAVGSNDAVFSSIKPFYIEPKLPVEISLGDKLIIPLAFINNTALTLGGSAEIYINNKKVETVQLSLDKGKRLRKNIPVNFEQAVGKAEIVIKALFGKYTDSVTRTFKINPTGFPVEENAGGIIGPQKEAEVSLTIPNQTVKGSMESKIMIYPSPVANLTQALEALIREPYGCFEQTSSTSYPLVMAQQYFLSHTGVDPALIKKSKENLDAAYKRLTGFECDKYGYEWFGEGEGHEALTAYGLMEFLEMKNVMDVDPKMIQRTRDWLLNRKDGKGSFERNARALDSFGGAPQETTDAYIVWTLTAAGEKTISKELQKVKDNAMITADSYVIALAANALFEAGDKTSAVKLMRFLAGKQTADGLVAGSITSITRSSGEALDIETTSLAVLAWMQDGQFAGNVENGMRYIVKQCRQGMFYSTQGTILALKAIILYDKNRAKPKAAGEANLLIDGVIYGGVVSFTKESKGIIELSDITPVLTPGDHKITLQMSGGSDMPFSITVKYNTLTPASSKKCKLNLDIALTNNNIKEGSAAEFLVKVENITKEVIPTPVAVISIPGGLSPRHDQLKELVKSGRIAFYEIINQEIVLYWRSIAPSAKLEFPIGFIADIPGTYTGPASRIYEYYTNVEKNWEEGKTVTIQAN